MVVGLGVVLKSLKYIIINIIIIIIIGTLEYLFLKLVYRYYVGYSVGGA